MQPLRYLSLEQMRQIHGLIIQEAYLAMFRQLNRRTCGLVRGSNAGGSPYPFALYSDTYAHRGFIQALANSSLAGVLWCSEVRDATSDEDWVRRFQTALFSPVMQLNGWSNGVKPWSRAAETDLVRDQLKLRMRLIPYLYTTMADYHRYGVPPIRHMVLEAGSSSSAEVIPGQLDGQNHVACGFKSVSQGGIVQRIRSFGKIHVITDGRRLARGNLSDKFGVHGTRPRPAAETGDGSVVYLHDDDARVRGARWV